jgi:GNAT superfamily N-acetyltransferase
MAEFYDEAGFPLPVDPAARSFTQLLDDPRLGESWLVEEDRSVVGYLVVTFGFSMEFGGTRAFVDDFFVRRSSRGQGLGAAALQTVRKECSDRGVRALLVETGPDEHPARRLYAREGFEVTGRVLLSQALAPPVHEL